MQNSEEMEFVLGENLLVGSKNGFGQVGDGTLSLHGKSGEKDQKKHDVI